MIDTVALTIQAGRYYLLSPDRFSPSARELLTPNGPTIRGGFLKYVHNATKADTARFGYLPKLTITHRIIGGKIRTPLRVEFSVPKLFFGDNVNELSDSDFEAVLCTLAEKIGQMGIKVTKDALRAAEVSAVHFGKNIVLSDGYTVSSAIRELGKIDATKRLDLNRTHFRNDGDALYLYASSWQMIWYDKILDIAKPLARSADKEKTAEQLSLFEAVKAQNERLELLRFEIRLAKRQKIKQLFKSLGLKEEPTFEDVFPCAVSQKVLLHHWSGFNTELNKLMLGFIPKPVDALVSLVTQPRKVQAIQSLAKIGLIYLSRDEGVRKVRQIIDDSYGAKTWERVKKLSQDFPIASKYGFVQEIESALRVFEPYRYVKDIGNNRKSAAQWIKEH